MIEKKLIILNNKEVDKISYTIFLNNKKIEIYDLDYTVLQLCEHLNISVPRFCYHRELSIAGNCRMCIVEIKNSVKPVIACATSLSKNMSIFTNTELVKISRENVLEFLLINHPLDCPICDQGGECDSQDQTMIYGSDRGRFKEIKRSVEDKYFGPVVKTIMTRCIHCTRCIRYSEEIAGISILGTMGRGKDTEISTYISNSLHSELIGNIVDICPVGALTLKPYAFKARPWELQSTTCIDIFDSLCSSILLQVKGQELMRVLPVRNDKLNKEWITDKVRFFYEGALLNRLLFAMVNKCNNANELQLVNCSLNIALILYVNEYKKALLKDKIMLSLCGNEYHLMEIYFLQFFMSNFGIFLYNSESKNKINFDFRVNYLLNCDLEDLIRKQNFILLNVNLKYENAILNSLLFKNMNERENINIYYIGIYFKNIYDVSHLGLGINLLKNIQKGQNEFRNIIEKKTLHWISSEQSILHSGIHNYVQSFKLNRINNSYSYIALNSTELNKNEIGLEWNINVIDVKNMELGFLHILGDSINERKEWLESDFVVYQSHHLPENNIESYNLLLPVISFYEIGNRLSEMIWLNNQLKSAYFFDPIITASGDGKTNEYYLLLLSQLIKTELNISHSIEWDTVKWINILSIYNLYKKAYDYNFYKIKHQLFNNNIYLNNINKVNPTIYYKSNMYSNNSVTLNSIYLNELRMVDSYLSI